MPEAVPALIAALRHPDSGVRAKVHLILQAIGAPAVLALVAALRDPFTRDTIMLILRRIAAVPSLLAALPQVPERLRRYVRVVIADIGAAALPALAEALASDDAVLRQEAVLALALFEGDEAREMLVDATMHPDDSFAARAILALVERGGEAAIRAMLRTLQHPDERIVTRTFMTLMQLDDPGGVVLVGAAMKDERDFVRILGARAVPTLVRQGFLPYEEAVEILKIRMRDKSFIVGDSARVTLEWLQGHYGG